MIEIRCDNCERKSPLRLKKQRHIDKGETRYFQCEHCLKRTDYMHITKKGCRLEREIQKVRNRAPNSDELYALIEKLKKETSKPNG